MMAPEIPLKLRQNLFLSALLWLVLPALLYWLGRIWLLAGRGQMQEDPVKFALSDRKSLSCVALIGAIAVVARFTPEWLSAALH